jgi:hypothetical protein
MSQLPTPQNNAPQQNTPDIISSICEDPSFLGAVGNGSPGGAAGGVYSSIPDGETYENIQDVWYRGKVAGTISRFVKFDGKPIPVEIAGFLKSMIDGAARDGVRIVVTSGFRTMAQQTQLKRDDPYNAATAGTSPHQRGFAVDMDSRGKGRYEWLVKNAYRYGFVRTVTRERWHWEYRGTWAGQQQPVWATAAFGWSPLSQFSAVKRNHICGGVNGGSKVLSPGSRWGEAAGANHPDTRLGGASNTWTDRDGTFLPDKFDREDPGWDQRGPATIPPTETPET